MIPLFNTNDIAEDSSKGFSVNEKHLFAVKKAGQIFLYLNQCPHLNINLEFVPDEFLDSEKNYIQCVNHGALFEIESGHCIAGPCSGQSLTPIEFTIENNQVFVSTTL